MVVSETQGIKSHFSYFHNNYILQKSKLFYLRKKLIEFIIWCHSWIIYNQLSHIKIKLKI